MMQRDNWLEQSSWFYKNEQLHIDKELRVVRTIIMTTNYIIMIPESLHTNNILNNYKKVIPE
jgi:hypothetical protein